MEHAESFEASLARAPPFTSRRRAGESRSSDARRTFASQGLDRDECSRIALGSIIAKQSGSRTSPLLSTRTAVIFVGALTRWSSRVSELSRIIKRSRTHVRVERRAPWRQSLRQRAGSAMRRTL
jgi:hypothetical protein